MIIIFNLHSASKYSSSAVSSRGNGGTGNELILNLFAFKLSTDVCRLCFVDNGSLIVVDEFSFVSLLFSLIVNRPS